jgi:putative hydrolase of the HAD superfamily
VGVVRRKPQWLFDMDNVLHNGMAQIFPAVGADMTAYLRQHLSLSDEQANAMRLRLWRRYGATLTGLQREQPRFDSAHFLAQTHALPELERWVKVDTPKRRVLADQLRRMRPRPVVLTNAPRAYAKRVLRSLGLAPFVARLFSIEDMVFCGHWMPKPSTRLLRRIAAKLRVRPSSCMHAEDTYANLRPARAIKMRTAYVGGYLRGYERTKAQSKHLLTGVNRRLGVQVRSAHQLSRLTPRW